MFGNQLGPLCCYYSHTWPHGNCTSQFPKLNRGKHLTTPTSIAAVSRRPARLCVCIIRVQTFPPFEHTIVHWCSLSPGEHVCSIVFSPFVHTAYPVVVDFTHPGGGGGGSGVGVDGGGVGGAATCYPFPKCFRLFVSRFDTPYNL